MKLILYIFLFVGLLTPWFSQAVDDHELSISVEGDRQTIETLVTFGILLDGRVLTGNELTELNVRLFQNTKEIFHTSSLELFDTEFTYRFSAPGQYYFELTGLHTDGTSIKNRYVMTIADFPAEPQTIARGVLILLISGGVLLSLTLSFLIIIRKSGPIFKRNG